MLRLGRGGTCAVLQCRLTIAARHGRLHLQAPRRWHSTTPNDGSARGRAAAAAAGDAHAAQGAAPPPTARTALSMETLLKVALGIPLLAPSLFFIGQGMEEKTFLAEVEAWSQQAQYQHSDAERLAARDCVRYIMAGQVAGLAVGGAVGWAIGGLRAVPIAVFAMVGGQVGAVYPTQLTTRSLLTLPGAQCTLCSALLHSSLLSSQLI